MVNLRSLSVFLWVALLLVCSAAEADEVVANDPSPEYLQLTAELEQLKTFEPERAVQQLDILLNKTQPPTYKAQVLLSYLSVIDGARQWQHFPRVEQAISSLISQPLTNQLKFQLSHNLGMSYYRQGKYQQALDEFKRALSFDAEYTHLKSMIHYMLGTSHAQLGDLSKGLEGIKKAYDMQVEFEGKASPRVVFGLGAIFSYMKKNDKAIEYTQMAIDLTPPDSPTLVDLYANLGAMYSETKQYEKSLEILRKAEEIAKQHNNTDIENIINNKGVNYSELGLYQDAVDTYKQALALAKKNNNPVYQTVYLHNIGENYRNLGDLKTSTEYLEQAYERYKEGGRAIKRLEFYPEIIENYRLLKNYKRAYELMVEYKALYDESMSLEAKQKFDQSQAAFELATKEKSLVEAQLKEAKTEQDILQLQTEQARQQSHQQLLFGAVILVGILLVFIAVAYRIKSNAYSKVEQLALHDHLTGLLNRRAIYPLLQDERDRAERYQQTFSVVLLDIDHFKQINDNYGHGCGDMVLKQIAQCLQDNVRSTDKVCRWGGEEFLIMLPQTGQNDAYVLAEKIRESTARLSVIYEQQSLSATISLGIAQYADGEPYGNAIQRADEALYSAKENGRNNTAIARQPS